MDDIITGIEKLAGYLDETSLQKLRLGAQLHKRHSRIGFTVIHCTVDVLEVSVHQDDNPAKRYFSSQRLEEIVWQMFSPFSQAGQEIKVAAQPFGAG